MVFRSMSRFYGTGSRPRCLPGLIIDIHLSFTPVPPGGMGEVVG